MNTVRASLFVVAFLQVTYAQLIDDLVQEYKPLITERERNLGLNIGLNGKQIGETYGALEVNIRGNLLNLTEKLARLDDVLKASVVRAKEENKNIDTCIMEERSRLGLLNVREIQVCRNIKELVLAQRKLSQLGLAQRDLGSLLSRCILLNQLDNTKIRSCLDNELLRIDDSVASINSEIQSLINNSLSIGEECIDVRRKSLENLLVDIEEQLSQCVDGILKD